MKSKLNWWKTAVFPFLSLLLLLLSACQNAAAPATDTPQLLATATATATHTQPPAPTDTATAVSPSATPSPTLAPSPTPMPDLSLSADKVFLYPTPTIYAGDQVTLQILAYVPPNVSADAVTVQVELNNMPLTNGTLGYRNLAGDAVGLFEWVWDTNEQMGAHTLEITLDPGDTIQVGDENPDNNIVTLNAVVNDPAQLSHLDANAAWISSETNCCMVYAVSGTAAYRDFPDLLVMVEDAFQQASARLEEPPQRKYDVYLIDRIIGQGGYAGSGIVVSYLDRNYVSDGLYEVLVHEAVHLLDRQFAPQRITFLAEGLAVWASGGHYKQEDLTQRSAALVAIDRYIPLRELINDFYPVQHEIGYLEAAGFVSYLIDTYGWTQFRTFYSEVTGDKGSTPADAMDATMQQYFGVSLADAEAAWLGKLAERPYDNTAMIDLQTTLRFYDTMRRYQRLYDPTAYFLTAWLPYPQALRTDGNPADLTRHPGAEINIVLETMLQSVDTAVRTGDYQAANVTLDSINRVLDNDGLFIDPLSTQYLNVVRTAQAEGYEVQQLTFSGNHATVLATTPNSVALVPLNLTLEGSKWTLSN